MTQEKLDQANELQAKDRVMREIHEKIVAGIGKSISSTSGMYVAARELELDKLEKKLYKVCADHIMPVRKVVQDEFEKL